MSIKKGPHGPFFSPPARPEMGSQGHNTNNIPPATSHPAEKGDPYRPSPAITDLGRVNCGGQHWVLCPRSSSPLKRKYVHSCQAEKILLSAPEGLVESHKPFRDKNYVRNISFLADP